MRTVAYGEHPDTVFDLHVPSAAASGTTVVLLHGGFWRERYRRDLMEPLVPSLLDAGHVVVNLEYRRVGGDGGWPTTCTDVAAGVDALAALEVVDPARVVTVGHSAGGHLALWAAARHRLPLDTPGADPAVRPCLAVSQAGVNVLHAALDLGDGAAVDLLGGRDEALVRRADPAAWLPLGVPVVLVHGTADDTVPLDQSERWAALAHEAGDEVVLHELPGDHYDVIDPRHPTWHVVLDAVASLG